MKEMLTYTLDSFLRAVIRFWNNRFLPKDNPSEAFREEISYLRRRNDELISFILEALLPKTAESNESPAEEEFQSMGQPIETATQKRKRLERESFANWNRLVQEAKDRAVQSASGKTTSELELETLGVNN